MFSLQRERKSRARTTSGPGDRITPNMAVVHFLSLSLSPYLFFFLLPSFLLVASRAALASAAQIAVMF